MTTPLCQGLTAPHKRWVISLKPHCVTCFHTPGTCCGMASPEAAADTDSGVRDALSGINTCERRAGKQAQQSSGQSGGLGSKALSPEELCQAQMARLCTCHQMCTSARWRSTDGRVYARLLLPTLRHALILLVRGPAPSGYCGSPLSPKLPAPHPVRSPTSQGHLMV